MIVRALRVQRTFFKLPSKGFSHHESTQKGGLADQVQWSANPSEALPLGEVRHPMDAIVINLPVNVEEGRAILTILLLLLKVLGAALVVITNAIGLRRRLRQRETER